MVRLVRAEKMVLSGLVFARKIARMILIQNKQSLMGPLMINMAFMPLYMWEMWDVKPVTHERTDGQWKVEQYSVWAESAIFRGQLTNKKEKTCHISSSGRQVQSEDLRGQLQLLPLSVGKLWTLWKQVLTKISKWKMMKMKRISLTWTYKVV